MINIKKHIIEDSKSIREAINQLNNNLGKNVTLFVINHNNQLIGSITDGDIRRGIVNGIELDAPLVNAMNSDFSYLEKNNYSIEKIHLFRKKRIGLLPIVNSEKNIIRIIEFDKRSSILPIDAVIIAGGEGRRLRPLTENTPKPLLKVGGVPIIERNVRRLIDYGVENIFITVRYLGDQIIEHFKNFDSEGTKIHFIEEKGEALGTFGSVTLVNQFEHDAVLVMNSDLLTNINFEDFFQEFQTQNADLSVGSIPYKVKVPYAVMETDNHQIKSLVEKPTYTYYSNAGIYLFKEKILENIPKNQKYDATDLIEKTINLKGKVVSFPILGYWLDIGKHEDYTRANEDIKHITF